MFTAIVIVFYSALRSAVLVHNFGSVKKFSLVKKFVWILVEPSMLL